METPTKPTRRSRHGLSALKAQIKVRGLQAIDRRTEAGRAMLAFRQELLADLGGEAAISTQERAIVDLATRTWLLISTVDRWLLEQRTLVNGRRKSLLPALRERQSLVSGLASLLAQVGLARRVKPVQDLNAYLRSRGPAEESALPAAPPTPIEAAAIPVEATPVTPEAA
jgi:hypothetical protein